MFAYCALPISTMPFKASLERTSIIQEFGEALKDEVEPRDAMHAHDQTLAGADTAFFATATCTGVTVDSSIILAIVTGAGITNRTGSAATSERRAAEHKMSAVGSAADGGSVSALQPRGFEYDNQTTIRYTSILARTGQSDCAEAL